MLYHFLTPLARVHVIFNLFTYISFRGAGAAATAIFLSLFIGPPVIRRLRRLGVGQIVRAEGPASHQSKQGTPTMGGIMIIVATIVPTLLWARLDNAYVLIAMAATIWTGAIGFADDYLKVVEGKSRGLVARYKLVGQVTFGVALGAYLLWQPPAPTIPPNATTLPFLKYVLVIFPPIVYVAFVTWVLTATTNAVNLTDGLDGLAIGLTIVAAATFAIFAYLFGRVDTSHFLLIYYLPGAGELSIFCLSLMGAAVGFLWYNAHPAEVFMGDTGSLAIGGAFGTVAILLKSEFLLLIVGGVFVAETVSVIVQTSVFKWHRRRRGREYAEQHRVFRMAPLHHHFEKIGWAESKIVTRFYILALLCALFALSTLKIR
ncbi:MAG TPA: phospho-N-acetylmuramoyl-pentapeptide-transferase [Gemmatimonadales bacterium]|nr:phospho-N-acetylmuramoyl-pentapeptide-transferase [Gemmatimonadales bacterium]